MNENIRHVSDVILNYCAQKRPMGFQDFSASVSSDVSEERQKRLIIQKTIIWRNNTLVC
jgi:hypothetical protein